MDTTIPRSSPKDVFVHLLVVATLYASAVSFISLLFQYVNILFPDQLGVYYSGVLNTIRRAGSALIIVFPVYIFLSWLLGRDFAAEPAKRQLRVRRWLLYFTLFISAVTIIVDLIILVYNFWGGELTSRFLFKILVVLIVAAIIFGYHIWDLRREENKKSSIPKITAWILSAVVLSSIIAGFVLAGSPATQRNRKFDDQRVMDLQTLQSAVINYWIAKDILPKSLEDLRNGVLGGTIPHDPQTNAAYEYTTTGKLEFNLCATFAVGNSYRGQYLNNDMSQAVPAGYYDPYQEDWSHEVGKVCFSKKIDPQLYKNANGGVRNVPIK